MYKSKIICTIIVPTDKHLLQKMTHMLQQITHLLQQMTYLLGAYLEPVTNPIGKSSAATNNSFFIIARPYIATDDLHVRLNYCNIIQ